MCLYSVFLTINITVNCLQEEKNTQRNQEIITKSSEARKWQLGVCRHKRGAQTHWDIFERCKPTGLADECDLGGGCEWKRRIEGNA